MATRTLAQNVAKLRSVVADINDAASYSELDKHTGLTTSLSNTPDMLYSVRLAGQLADGVSIYEEQFYVIFVSEGIEVQRYNIKDFDAVTELPAVPEVQDCISLGWNWTLAQIKTYIQNQTVTSNIVVGAMYKSVDDTTRLYISIPYGGRKTIPLYLKSSVVGGMTIDWGDGTTTNSDSTSAKTYSHTYDSIGDYVIRLINNSGTIQLGGASGSYNIFGSVTNSVSNPNRGYQSTLRKVIIGKGMTSIAAYTFYYCYSLQSVTIPSSVTSIGNYAFSWCCSLQSATIPNSITSIGSYAFQYCSSLSTVTIPNSVTAINNAAFTYCGSLQSITIPSSITSIATSMFQNCYSLQSVTIPNSVKTINNYAFQACYPLQSVTIPSSVTTTGTYIFNNCYSLQNKQFLNYQSKFSILLNSNAELRRKYTLCKCSNNIVLSNSVTSIADNTLQQCYSLQSVTIPNSVTSIGTYAIAACYSLQSITIPNSVKTINNYAFQNCYSLQSVTIPNTATSIGSNVFQYCYSLQSVTIPNSVTSIGSYAFSGCYSLQSVTIPNSVTSIGSYTFSGCQSLQSVTIPNSVTSIGDHALYYCYSIQSITIPSSVTSIGSYAFYYCYSLTYVKYNSSANIPSSCFSGCNGIKTYDFSEATKVITLGATSYLTINNDTQIVVPDSLYDSWIAAANWSSSTIVSKIIKASEVNLS